jgi:hypothetical protein
MKFGSVLAKAAQQLDGADPASRVLSSARYWPWLAGRLISRPLGSKHDPDTR